MFRLNIGKKSEILRIIRIKTTNRPAWGNFDPILGIFDPTIFSYFSKYQFVPKTVKSFILHLHFFYQYYSVRSIIRLRAFHLCCLLFFNIYITTVIYFYYFFVLILLFYFLFNFVVISA